MIDPREFAKKQFELATEFGKYVFVHPEVDERLSDGRLSISKLRVSRTLASIVRNSRRGSGAKKGCPWSWYT
jgi:hypothetical protein